MPLRTCAALFVIALLLAQGAVADARCRYAPQFTTEAVLRDAETRRAFLDAHAEMESRFVTHLGVNAATQLTYDGHRLDADIGLPFGDPHLFSAPSKESVHVGIIARVLADAADGTAGARSLKVMNASHALWVLEKKATAYERFDAAYPGFGGFLPWYAFANTSTAQTTPAWNWKNRVPALDNGEWFWAVFAVAHVLRTRYNATHAALATRYDAVWQRMVQHGMPVFYGGDGCVRAVTNIANETWPVGNNTYSGDSSGCLDDPYEGELFTFMLELLAPEWTNNDTAALWRRKRHMLQAVNLSVGVPSESHGRAAADATVRNITVQKGFWFSAHEQWKYMMLPYRRSAVNDAVFTNGERARTWFAATPAVSATKSTTDPGLVRPSPSMWASVNGPVATNADNIPYFSACGVQPIAFERVTADGVVTPYSTFPLLLASPAHGAAWLYHSLLADRAQNCFGTTESLNVTGTTVSPLTTWDSKATTLLASLGGITDLTEARLRDMGLLDAFVAKVDSEWTREFGMSLPLPGAELGYALPAAQIPPVLGDWPTCNATSPACPAWP